MSKEPQAAFCLVEQHQRIMATGMSVHLAVAPAEITRAQGAIDACMTWLAEVSDQLTRFIKESELSRLNASAGQWTIVSDLLYTVIEQSMSAAEASDGLFHPALLPLLEELGYDRDFDAIAEREVAQASGPVPPSSAINTEWRDIALDPLRRRVRLPTGLRLDLGGIVKGWAADSALDRFFWPFDNVLVNAGGDMRARGGPDEGVGWPIGVGSTPSDAEGVVLTLARGGIATSGASNRWWLAGGVRRHHLLDPRTNEPAKVWIDPDDDTELIATATALAPTAAHAEVAAKVALLRGVSNALDRVERAWQNHEHEQAMAGYYGDRGVALLLRMGSGDVRCSANLKAYLATCGGGGNLWLD